MKRPIVRKVVYKKMRDACGLAEGGIVYIDPRAKGIKHLELMCHEQLHVLAPELTEEDVTYIAAQIAVGLWRQGYRRTDGDISQKLQDGTKFTTL